MAYPVVSAPYGLLAQNLIGGQVFAGSTRMYNIQYGYATSIFYGDFVVLSRGFATRASVGTGTGLNQTVGIFLGCTYTNPTTKQKLFSQYWPASTAAGDCQAFVLDDPDALFQIKGSAALGTFNSGTAGSGWPGAIGKNAALGFGSGGNTTTGISSFNLVVGSNGGSLAATSTLALRIVDVVRGTESDDYPEFIVKLNVGVHSYNNSLGV